MALTSCTPPAKGSPLFELGDDEMEMGVGIHGEPGRRREKLAGANAIVDELLEAIASDLPFYHGRQRRADDQRPRRHADLRALHPLRARAPAARGAAASTSTRSYVGEYCTSLDMAGASLTLVKLDDELNGAARRAGGDRGPHLLAIRARLLDGGGGPARREPAARADRQRWVPRVARVVAAAQAQAEHGAARPDQFLVDAAAAEARERGRWPGAGQTRVR